MFDKKSKITTPPVRRGRIQVLPSFDPAAQIQRAQIRQVLRAPQVQAKLTIGQPKDKYEQEADRVADEVMRMPKPRVQRQEEPEEEEILQTKGRKGQTPKVTPDLESHIQSLKGTGQFLPKSVRNFFEPRFGHDFDKVRIHTNSEAAKLSRAMNAKAFATGRNIVFGPGQYAPEATAGKRLLAHELTHVVQWSNKRDRTPVESGTQSTRVSRKVNEGEPELPIGEAEKTVIFWLERLGYPADFWFALIKEGIPATSWTPSFLDWIAVFFESLGRIADLASCVGCLISLIKAPTLATEVEKESAVKAIAIKAVAYGITSWIFYPKVKILPKHLPKGDLEALRSNEFLAGKEYIFDHAKEVWFKQWSAATWAMIKWSNEIVKEYKLNISEGRKKKKVKDNKEYIKAPLRIKLNNDPKVCAKNIFDHMVKELEGSILVTPSYLEMLKLTKIDYPY